MLARVDTPNGPRTIRIDGKADAQRAVGLLFACNLDVVGNLPPLYRSRVRYERETPGRMEDWQAADRCLASGRGDCEDLAAWRAAELVVSGVDPSARPWVYSPRPRLLHVVTLRADGPEDPSAFLGMRRSMVNGVKYAFRGRRGAVECGIDFPIAGDRMKVRGVGSTRAEAAIDACDRLNSLLLETGAVDLDEVGGVGSTIGAVLGGAGGAQVGSWIDSAFSSLGSKLLGTDYDALGDLIRNVGRADAGIELTGAPDQRAAELRKLWNAGVGILYCSDSDGARDALFPKFNAAGWTGVKRWSHAYDSGAGQKTWWYALILPKGSAPQRAIDEAKRLGSGDPEGWIRRAIDWALDVKGKARDAANDWPTFEALSVPIVGAEAGPELRPMPNALARGGQDEVTIRPVPQEPPIVAPSAIDKIDRIRELGELVRDGHLRRLQVVIRRGGPVARFARELLR
jgi:hypothetical protein